MPDKDTTQLPKDSSKEIGASGTLIFNGIITGEEYNKNLTGVRGNKQYEIMRRSDSTVRSALQIVKLPIESTTFDIEPAQAEDGEVTDDAKFKAGFIKRELLQRNINFPRFIKQGLTCLDFGFSVSEKVLELTDYEGKSLIGLKKLASRKQTSIWKWVMETTDQPGITQMVGDGSKYEIPREKLVIFTYDKEGDNDEGISLLRSIYKDWDMKDKLVLVNAMALEKMGIGVPIVKGTNPDVTPTPKDKAAAIDALANMRSNQSSYLEIPSTMTVEMLDMKASTTKEIIPTLNYHDGRIMTGVLARFMELGGASGTGSQSLASDLSSIFMKSEEALIKDMIATITDDIIKQLCDLNFSDMSEGYPKLTYGDIADDDTVALAGAIQNLMTAGAITPDVGIEENLRDRLRLPGMSKEDKENYKANKSQLGLEDDAGTTKTGDKAVSEKDAKDAGLKKEEDVQASLAQARQYRNQLLASLSEE